MTESETRYDITLYCETESKWVNGTSRDAEWCKCFNNSTHVVHPGSPHIVNTISPQVVRISEEETKTNGNYKCDCVKFTAAAAVGGVPTVTTHDIQYPFAINLLNTRSVLGPEHSGNQLSVYFIPDTIIGASTQISGANSDSILSISAVSMAHVAIGLDAVISDSDGSESLGQVAAIDLTTNQVTVSGDPLRSYAKNSDIRFIQPESRYQAITLPERHVALTSTTNWVVGPATIAGTAVTVTAVNHILRAVTIDQLTSFTAGTSASCAFEINRTLTQISTGTTLFCSPIGLQVGLQVTVGTTPVGQILTVGTDRITVENSSGPHAIGKDIKFNGVANTTVEVDVYTTPKIKVAHTDVLVNRQLTIAGVPSGSVTAVSGDVLTMSVWPPLHRGEIVFLAYEYSTSILEDCLPLTVIEVDGSAAKYAQTGMSAKLTDGVITDDLGLIVSVDIIRKHVKVSQAPTRSFGPGSYLSVTRYYIHDFEFGGAGEYHFSTTRNKGSYIEPGRTGRFEYTNYSDTATRFTMQLEYLH